MITVQTVAQDLTQIRFAYSPLVESTLSYKFLLGIMDRWYMQCQPYRIPTPQEQNWAEDAWLRMGADQVELPYLTALIHPNYIADFATPTPHRPGGSLNSELRDLLATPHDIVWKNVEELIELGGENRERLHYLHDPEEALNRLVAELEIYWDRVFKVEWSRIQTVLENDVLYRARSMVLKGVEATLQDISEQMSFDVDTIVLKKSYNTCGLRNTQLNGNGFQLVPSLFAGVKHVYWQVNEDWRPMFIYGARGAGQRKSQDLQPEEAMEITLGASKARILQALVEPINTGQLAEMLHLTAGSVSQQMGKLTQAGLVESNRNGNKVYYRLSPRGEKLLDVFVDY
jgi:DNA-binding transcriptional ArsR family regulator